MNALRRLTRGLEKYGWRSPIFLGVAALAPLDAIIQSSRRARITLLSGGTIARSATVEEDVFVSPRARIDVGEGVFIGRRGVFEISNAPGSCLTIGAGSWISHDCHITCVATVTLGRKVLIGEFVSIRDTTHIHDRVDVPIKDQGDISGPVVIEDGAWIGRGVLIQAGPGGIRIGAHSIIAANSVVRSDVPPRTIWGGAPARLLKARG